MWLFVDFMKNKSRDVAWSFLKGDIKLWRMPATMVDQQRKCLGFGPTKTIKFGTFSMISHAQSCLSQNLFFIHLITSRTFKLGKSLRTTQVYFYWSTQMYIFDCQQIWKTYTIFHEGAAIKNIVISIEVRSRSIVLLYFKYCILKG